MVRAASRTRDLLHFLLLDIRSQHYSHLIDISLFSNYLRRFQSMLYLTDNSNFCELAFQLIGHLKARINIVKDKLNEFIAQVTQKKLTVAKLKSPHQEEQSQTQIAQQCGQHFPSKKSLQELGAIVQPVLVPIVQQLRHQVIKRDKSEQASQCRGEITLQPQPQKPDQVAQQIKYEAIERQYQKELQKRRNAKKKYFSKVKLVEFKPPKPLDRKFHFEQSKDKSRKSTKLIESVEKIKITSVSKFKRRVSIQKTGYLVDEERKGFIEMFKKRATVFPAQIRQRRQPSISVKADKEDACEKGCSPSLSLHLQKSGFPKSPKSRLANKKIEARPVVPRESVPKQTLQPTELTLQQAQSEAKLLLFLCGQIKR